MLAGCDVPMMPAFSIVTPETAMEKAIEAAALASASLIRLMRYEICDNRIFSLISGFIDVDDRSI